MSDVFYKLLPSDIAIGSDADRLGEIVVGPFRERFGGCIDAEAPSLALVPADAAHVSC